MISIICVSIVCITVGFMAVLGYRTAMAAIYGQRDETPMTSPVFFEYFDKLSMRIDKLSNEVSSHSIALGVREKR
jgi:hypothetical protein